jgi:hypothetical protein
LESKKYKLQIAKELYITSHCPQILLFIIITGENKTTKNENLDNSGLYRPTILDTANAITKSKNNDINLIQYNPLKLKTVPTHMRYT